jgi:LmbE family N-acetylglucosaminyl deacetylase
MNNVIVISAHPDDETLGVGGTILRHVAEGDNVYWLNITSINESQGFSKEKVFERAQEIEKVHSEFGFKQKFLLDYPTMSLSGSSLQKLIPEISNIFNSIGVNIIYCLNRSDAHSDHRIVFDAVMACTKTFRYPTIKKVLCYECLSETEFAPLLADRMFIPNYFVDITNYFEKKIEIMKIYSSELGEFPFPRSIKTIESLASLRGSMIGKTYAEAFQVIKIIE